MIYKTVFEDSTHRFEVVLHPDGSLAYAVAYVYNSDGNLLESFYVDGDRIIS